jgi:HSP20 family protein
MQNQETALKHTDESNAAGTARPLAKKPLFMPRADVYETRDALIVEADVPGADEKSVDITLEKNVLTVRGHVEFPNYEGYTAAYEEYAVGDYERAFTLGNEIDRDGIVATVRNGVLKVVLPKAQNAKPRQIVVKAE